MVWVVQASLTGRWVLKVSMALRRLPLQDQGTCSKQRLSRECQERRGWRSDITRDWRGEIDVPFLCESPSERSAYRERVRPPLKQLPSSGFETMQYKGRSTIGEVLAQVASSRKAAVILGIPNSRVR